MSIRRSLITAIVTAIVVTISGRASAAQMDKQLKKLPAAVQAAVKEQTKGATLVGVSEEKADGKAVYEVETKVNGRTRDLLIDRAGTVIEVEEEVTLEMLPAAVQSALSARGKVLKVETLTKGSTVTYEAQVEKNGKKSEVVVDATGKVR